MRTVKLVLLVLTMFAFSCTQTPNKVEEKKEAEKIEAPKKESSMVGLPIVSEADITVTFGKFWDYYSNKIELYEDFVAFDTKGNVINKLQFLNQLKSGLYFPLAIYSKDEQLNYKLAKIPAKADPNISAYMKQFSHNELIFFKMQGKPFPHFNFTDINGKIYTSENTKGKIVLFKCWYIGCVACVNEIPALNELVKKYQDRKDILFISLAMDNKSELQQFFKRVKFDYATVPNQEDYMSKQLDVRAYPTHFLINRKGIMVRSLPDDIQVGEALAKEIAK
ncbi:redoxin domain-containing protein [Pedobacter sp. LMG 31464]|uniref:Redoxin domain-containing protein n=1 Tax=Pedobacter planticolens TaxID=2679964 RepID=A0A923DUT3_9SPHI|nr:TlpA disulfide reductase family protein [Pedobacter planticolens]MBB2144276.1 redoxin domain-containing protein [Pedobacter planticolens]